MVSEEKRSYGEDEEGKKIILQDELGWNWTECPVSYADNNVRFLSNLVSWSEECGVMPVEGGLLEQSAYYMEVRNIVVSERNKIQADKMKTDAEKRASVASKAPMGDVPGRVR